MRSITVQDYQELARARNWEFLGSDTPDNVKELAPWRCNNGHIVEMSYDNLRRPERGCKFCSLHWRKNDGDYRWAGHVHGLTPLDIGANSRTKVRWRDSKGNIVERTLRQLITVKSTYRGTTMDIEAAYQRERVQEMVREVSGKYRNSVKRTLDSEGDS